MKMVVASLFLLLGAFLLQAEDIIKPGKCPIRTEICKEVLRPMCKRDGDCLQDLKCCYSCGKRCLSPY